VTFLFYVCSEVYQILVEISWAWALLYQNQLWYAEKSQWCRKTYLG